MSTHTDDFINALKKLKTNLKKAEDYEDENDIQDYGLDPEDLEGLTVTDDPFSEEGDEADKWLAEHEGKGQKEKPEEKPEEKPAAKEKTVSPSGYSEWKPRGDYTPKEKADIKKLTDAGYSEREAERLAGAHRGPTDFQTALTHPVKPSHPSEKMLSELKELAGPWLENANRHSRLNADPEKNPQKFAAGQMLQAHEAHSKDYNKAYHDFLSSDQVKDLKGRDRHKAIREWKNQWHSENPGYKENLGAVSEAGKHYQEAPKIARQSLNDRIAHITSGGESTGMGMAEAAQHVGGTKTDEGYTASVVQDPSMAFASQNPELIRVLKQHKNGPDMIDRMNRVNAARATKGVKIRRKGEQS